MNKLDYRFLNFIIRLLGIVLAFSALFAVSKYIGLLNVIFKVINALLPVLFAIVLSVLSEPLIGFFERRHIKRKPSVLLTYGLELTLVILIIAIIFPQLFKQLNAFFTLIPNLIETLEKEIDKISTSLGIDLTFGNDFTNFLPKALEVITTTIQTLINITLSFCGAVFLSFDFIKFKEAIKRLIPKKYKEATIEFFVEFIPFVHKYCFGMLLDATILWLMTSFAFQLVGLPYAFMFGFIVAMCDLIPIIGPFIGGIPAVIIALSFSWRFALIILLILIIAQIIEANITQPFILKNVIALHPLEGIAGIAILGSLFGFLGLIASPIVVTAFKIIVKNRKQAKK